jgi:O-antigen/teichoic acid export membrane protein
MSATQRIAKNTVLMYGRTIAQILIGLFSTRYILESLGADDFGLYGLVGALIGWLAFLNSSLAGATQRFLSYYRKTEVSKIFSNAMLVHLGIALFFLLCIEVVGSLFLGKLNILPHRLDAAFFLLHTIGMSSFFGIISTPFSALMTAYEDLHFFAGLAFFQSVLQLAIALFLFVSPFDRLETYGFLMAALQCVVFLAQAVFCWKQYPGVHFQLRLRDITTIKSMFSFAGFHFLEMLSDAVKFQGMPIILNLSFGTAINAAYAVANQVYTKVAAFSYALQQAAGPQIVSGIAEGSHSRSQSLALSTCKFSFFLVCLFSVPLILNIDFVLSLWLKSVPEYAAPYSALFLFWFCVASLPAALNLLIEGDGRIVRFKIWMCVANLFSFGVAYAAVRTMQDPLSIFLGLYASELFIAFLRIYFARRLCGLSLKSYFGNMLKIVLLVGCASGIAYLSSFAAFSHSWVRFVCTTGIFVFASFGGLWWALNFKEKQFVHFIFERFKQKLKKESR